MADFTINPAPIRNVTDLAVNVQPPDETGIPQGAAPAGQNSQTNAAQQPKQPSIYGPIPPVPTQEAVEGSSSTSMTGSAFSFRATEKNTM